MKGLLKSAVTRVFALLLVVAFAVAFISLRLKNNDLKSQANLLREQIAEAEDSIGELKADLEKPFDNEYVAEIARRELGLRYPQEIVFYSDEGK